MIPEAVIAMLACTNIGAVHVVVFGGFAPTECAKRVDSAEPVVVLTASCGIEGSRIIPYLPFIRETLRKASYKPRFTVVYQRSQHRAILSETELDWNQLTEAARLENTNRCSKNSILLPATSHHYIIHTSGTTGTPKGVVRPLSHLVGLSYFTRNVFGLQTGDTIFCASDIGWVVGHSFIVYGPLLVGATSILYEGKPVGTPDAGSFWRIIETYSAKVVFCAPSALRAIVAHDPALERIKERNLRSLRKLFLAGEHSEPALISRFADCLPSDVNIIDHWWSTESGCPITGLLPGQHAKPGFVGVPLPGWQVHVVDDLGDEVPPGTMGNIVLGLPLAPTALTTLWKEPDRFCKSYFARFDGRWMDMGDVGMFDTDGYLSVIGRSDDVINVAAHRLGTAVIEGAIVGVATVQEAYVVPMHDELKGQVPVAFVVPGQGFPPAHQATSAIKDAVRREVGPIASLKAVVFIPATAVPRTRSGKVMRRALRGALEQGSRVMAPEGVCEHDWKQVLFGIEDAGLLRAEVSSKL